MAAFAVILATVVIQGTSLGAVIRLARLDDQDGHRPRLTLSQAEAAIGSAQLRRVETLAYDAGGRSSTPIARPLSQEGHSHGRLCEREEALSATLQAHFHVVLQAIGAGRAELIRLHRSGEHRRGDASRT